MVISLFCLIFSQTTFAAENDIISFADNNLKTALINSGADLNNDGDITEGELSSCTELYLSNSGISNLSGLQYATSVTDLDLSGNSISDISAVSGLTNLTKLNLGDNAITSITAVANLTALTNLHLNNNQISNISALSGLSNLNTLCLQFNQISSLAPLTGHAQLVYLNLANNIISSLTGLNDFTVLEYLFLSNNKITSITPLENFKGKFLYLDDNNIADITPLANITTITNLSLDRNKISDVSPLSNMTLFSLSFSGNPVKDISSIQDQQNNVSILTMHNNYVDLFKNITNNIVGGLMVSNLQANGATLNTDPQKLERVCGPDRVDTAVSVALDGWSSAENVILVNYTAFIDSMSITPLTKALNAPVLLTTNSYGWLDYPVKDALAKLNAKTVYIIGGPGSVSDTIKNELSANYAVVRIAGSGSV